MSECVDHARVRQSNARSTGFRASANTFVFVFVPGSGCTHRNRMRYAHGVPSRSLALSLPTVYFTPSKQCAVSPLLSPFPCFLSRFTSADILVRLRCCGCSDLSLSGSSLTHPLLFLRCGSWGVARCHSTFCSPSPPSPYLKRTPRPAINSNQHAPRATTTTAAHNGPASLRFIFLAKTGRTSRERTEKEKEQVRTPHPLRSLYLFISKAHRLLPPPPCRYHHGGAYIYIYIYYTHTHTLLLAALRIFVLADECVGFSAPFVFPISSHT